MASEIDQESPKSQIPAVLIRQSSTPTTPPPPSRVFSMLRNLVGYKGKCMTSATSDVSERQRKGKAPAAEDSVGKSMAGRSGGVSWGSTKVIGMRDSMEDYCASIGGLFNMTCRDFGGCSAPDTDHAGKTAAVHYFAVFDGHRGHQVSEFCANVLHDMVVEEWEKQAAEDVVRWAERWSTAFTRAFERADEIFKGRTLEVRFAGSTASVVLVSPCQIVASNCGDSKAILCRGREVIPLTFDHKPSRQEEADRIERIGGKIFRINGLRVEGVLAMTRAIGDHDLKPFVISTPDVTFTRRSHEDEFLVVATDGLWDVLSIEMVARFARNRLPVYKSFASPLLPASAVADDLVHKALVNSSKDNVTVIVVDLRPLWKSKRCH